VHPYRQASPETVVNEYHTFRDLVARYAPLGKTIPILSGEWGYSVSWGNYDQEIQGKYLARQWLINQWQQIPISIWYDWHDDGTDPKNAEHNFGMVRNAEHPGADLLYEPKPAYLAAKTLADQLNGFLCSGRMATASGNDYVLVFRRGDDIRLAAWTTAKNAKQLTIDASPGQLNVTSMTGDARSKLGANDGKLAITVSDEPEYLVPVGDNPILRAAATEHP
jgi:hypothetical protein